MKSSPENHKNQRDQSRAQGPAQPCRRQGGFTLIEILIGVAIVSILAMVGLPTYMDYLVRAKVIEDFVLARDLQFMVTEYYTLNGKLPISNDDLDLPRGRDIEGMWLRNARVQDNPSPGTIRLVYDERDKLQALVDRSVILWVPEIVEGRLIWDCTRGSMDDRYRPPNCRN